jgi:vancomycin resistance protein YoaR
VTENAGRDLSDLAPYDPESYEQHPESYDPAEPSYDASPYGAPPAADPSAGEFPAEAPLEFPPFPEQSQGPFRESPSGSPAAPPAAPPVPPAASSPAQPQPGRPQPSQPPPGGIRLSSDAEATARLRIKLPTVKPQPSTTLRPRFSWEDREADQSTVPDGVPRPRFGVTEATAFSQTVASPARPTALPSELAALTTATLVVPLPPDARPTPSLLTTTLPPNMAAQANAALLADAFHDTMEEIFGIDFDAVSRTEIGLTDTRFGRNRAAGRRAAAGSDFAAGSALERADDIRYDTDWLLEAFDPEPEPSVDPAFDALFAPLQSELADEPVIAYPAVTSTGSLPALSSTADFGGRYGVPTQPASFRTPAGGQSAQDPARHALALRYLGGIFHDSTGESAYLDAAADGLSAPVAATGALALFGAADAPTEQFSRIRLAELAGRPGAVAGSAAGAGAGAAGPAASTAVASTTASAAAASAAGSAGDPPAVPRPRRAGDGSRRAADSSAAHAEPSRGGRLVTAVALLVAAFAVLYGVALIMAGGVLGGTVPHGAVVDGISIGGLSPAAARHTLETGLDPAAARPIALVVGSTSTAVDPAAAGLSFDAGATVARADGERTDPLTVIPALFGLSHPVDPAVSVNSPLLTKTLTAVAASYDVAMVEGEITFTAGRPVVVEPKAGRSFNVADAFTAVTAGYLRANGPITVPAADLRPKATPAALQDALENMARPAVAGPVSVTTGAVTTVFSAAQIGDAVVIAPNADGDLVAEINGNLLRADLDPHALAQEQPAVDASFTITGGNPVLVPDHEGIGFSAAALSGALLPVLTEPLPRSMVLHAGDLPPAFTTADAQALGITNVLGVSTRQVVAAPGETASVSSSAATATLDANTARATVLVSGAVVEPGATFSFLSLVGAPTAANGFTVPAASARLGVDSTRATDAVATAVFNAAFSAGMGDTVHHPNASYQPGDPVGLDAAVVSSSTDLEWTNTGAHPVYLYANYTGGLLTVAVLGEKSYDQVNIQVSGRSDVVQAATTHGGYSCTAIQADPGFQVDVTRSLIRGGNQVGSEHFHVTYVPQNGVSCGSSSSSNTPSTGGGYSNGPSSPTSGSGGGSPAPPAPTPSPTDSGTLGGLFH